MTASSSKGSFWNNSVFKENPELMSECNMIKYAAYRLAAKLNILQQILGMEQIRVGLIAGVFDRHHLQKTENDVALEFAELEALLYDIFFAAKKENQSNIDVDSCTELMIDFLLNVYDRYENSTVPVVSVKLCLTVLSSSRLQEKYQYFFHQFSDHNNCISQKSFIHFLKNMTSLTEFLSESHSFGNQLIQATVDCCFSHSQGTLGVTENTFMNWLHQEPQLLVWLSTLYRLQAAELVLHFVKCSVCKMRPIKGLRYHCLRCLRYDQCQTCFFMGKVSKRHKLQHPMEEHCCMTTSKDSTLSFFKILKNKLCRTKTLTKLHYLPVQTRDVDGRNDYGDNSDGLLDEVQLSTQTVIHGLRVPKELQPYNELQSIISHLERDNRQLQRDIEKLWTKDGVCHVEECLQDHRALVEAQVNRLKLLKNQLLQLAPPPMPRQLERLESTPKVSAVPFRHRGILAAAPGLDEISPIMRPEEESRVSMEHKKLCAAPSGVDGSSRPRSPTPTGRAYVPTPSDCTVGDISSWFGNAATIGDTESPSGFKAWLEDSRPPPSPPPTSEKKLKELHEDLDQILDRLQKMLSANFSTEDSFSGKDNTELQRTTAEIEGLLTGLVDGVEMRKRSPPLSTAVK